MTARRRALAGFLFGWVSLAAAPAPPPQIAYELTPIVANGVPVSLEVTLRFVGPSDGTLQLDLPNEGEGERERWRTISALEAMGATISVPDPATRVLAFTPGAQVTVRYRVASAYAADPDGRDGNPYKGASLRPGWFESLGEFLFAVPHGGEAWPAAFEWGPLPRTWAVASDLEHGRMGRAMTVGDISESTLLGGIDVKVLKRPIPGGTLRLAVRGTWGFDADALADVLGQTVSAQRAFWGGDIKGPFLVTLTPLTGAGSSGGTGRSDAFALYGTPDTGELVFLRIIAHEHTHSWIPTRIGTLREVAREPEDYWFSEGFTDFYASRTLLRSGIWSLDEFVADMNERLLAYTISPARNAPNTQIVRDFWTNQKIQQLPYQRGFLLAFILDKRLHDAGKGNLDTVLFAARDAFVVAPTRPNAAENFLAAYARVAGSNLAPDLSRYVMAGESIALPADLFGACAAVQTVDLASYDPGFDRDKSAETGLITGVDPDGPAYAAGLRDGMKRIKRMGGKEGDPRVTLGYEVTDLDGKDRFISWLPAGKGHRPLQQVMLTPGLSDEERAACARAISGG